MTDHISLLTRAGCTCVESFFALDAFRHIHVDTTAIEYTCSRVRVKVRVDDFVNCQVVSIVLGDLDCY